MPIEIKELHIKMNVNETEGSDQMSGSAAANGNAGATASDASDDKIIAQCVEQVMQILQNKQER